jgi:hypothetical protein
MVSEVIKEAFKLTLTTAGEKAAERFFADLGVTNPNVRIKDGEEEFEAIITGSSVDKKVNLPIKFESDFWEGLLTLDQEAEGPFYGGADRLTVAMDINHKRDVHRDTDEFRGSLAQVKLEIDAADVEELIRESGNQYKAREQRDRKPHAKGHSDLYFGNLSATVSGDSIGSWTFRVTGEHLTRQVSSLLIPSAEGAPGGVATVLVLAPDAEVPPLASLSLALEFSPNLRLSNEDVRIGPLLASSVTHLGCEKPGRLELNAITRGDIRGPGVLAALDFHLPEGGRIRSYPIITPRLEGIGLDGQEVELSVNNTAVTVVG